MEHGIWNKRLSRRAMLGGIAGSVATAILAACGGSKATDTPSAAATTASNATSPTTAASSAAVATRPASSAAAVSTAPVTGSVAPAGTTAAASTTAGTGAPIYSPQGTKSPNFASTQNLRIVAAGDPKTLDPAVGQYAADISFIHLLYDAFFSFDDKGNLIPRAAATIPTQQNGGISSDGLTYTVKLRPGQKYSDGSPVLAKDYVYAAKRFINPATASNYASFAADIAGYKELYAATTNATPTAQTLQPLVDKLGITAPDDTTVVFKLANPQPVFTQVLSLWGFIPLKQSVVEAGGANWWQTPKNHVTNGAWVLDTFASNQNLIFKPNPNYTGEKPYLTQVEAKIIKDPAQIWTAYQNNELDLINVPTGNRQQVQSDPSYKNQILRGPQLTTFALSFNSKMAPFDKVEVRKAFATAIDRQTFINDVLKGIGKPTTAWIAPGEPGYNGDIGSQYKFDATKAKKILSDASIDPKSLTAKLTFVNSGDGPAIAQAIQAQMRQNLGVELQLDPQESKVYASLVSDKKQYQLTTGGWGADYPDPQDWLPELFGTNGGNNSYNYSNPQVDALFKQAAVEQDNTKRLALYGQAEKIIVDTDCAVGPIYNREWFFVHKPTLTGAVINPMDSNYIGDQHAFRGLQFTK